MSIWSDLKDVRTITASSEPMYASWHRRLEAAATPFFPRENAAGVLCDDELFIRGYDRSMESAQKLKRETSDYRTGLFSKRDAMGIAGKLLEQEIGITSDYHEISELLIKRLNAYDPKRVSAMIERRMNA